jgi:NAD(P) transhydrogenase
VTAASVDAYDLVVIGAGPAGQVAAELAALSGHRAAIIERNKPGGVVTTTGGAPTKALREAALHLSAYRDEDIHGARLAPALDEVLPTMRARVERVRDVLQDGVADSLAAHGVAYIRGTARFDSDRKLHVTAADGEQRQVVAHKVLIATGSRPAHLPGIPFDDAEVYDSDSIYTLSRVPKDVAIIGGGPVGVEFASVFSALDIPTTLVSDSQVLVPSMDAELTELLADDLERRGVHLMLGASVLGVRRTRGHLAVMLSGGTTVTADAVLVAAGRTPNSWDLGLEEAGVRVDARGRIVVDRYFRTSAPRIYAAGDVVKPALASTAMQQGRVAAAHACGVIFGLVADQTASSSVYGMPELAGVGATEQQVRADGIPYVVGRCELGTTPRGAIAGRGGLLKLIFRTDDRRLLGVHCFGEIASEIVGLGHVVIHMGGSVEVFLTLALNTPTYSSTYHAATVDGLTRLAQQMEVEADEPAHGASARSA